MEDLTQVGVSTVWEAEAGMGSRAACHSVRQTAQGETGSRLLLAFGGVVTHPLDKCHKPSLSSPINQLHPCVCTGRAEALIPRGAPSWAAEQKSLLRIAWPVHGWRGDLDKTSQQSLGQASLDLQKCRRNWNFALEKSTKILAIAGNEYWALL